MSEKKIEAQGKLERLSHGVLNRCFGCGERNKAGLRLRFYVDAEHVIVCRVRLARRFEGPPGHAHGGVIATLLDEAMSKANRQFGVLAMTRHIEVEYLKPVPLGAKLLLAGRHTGVGGRKHICEAELTNEKGELLAQATALFIEVDRKMLPGALRSRI
ncbi:MAG TPA: PaaI family thioesterase [Acidobacteriaceae bacterium]|nr:PaaI family thioesterase [Acidobacteriaceae bacterium]